MRTYFFVVLCYVVFTYPSGVLGSQLKGDAELLRTAASEYRQNLDRLKTWRGKVQHSADYKEPADADRRVRTSYDFAWDKQTGYLRTQRKYDSFVRIVNGKENTVVLPIDNMVIKDGALFSCPEITDDKFDFRECLIYSQDKFQPGIYSADFDPICYYRFRDIPLDEYLLTFYSGRDDPAAANTSIVQDKNLLTIETNFEAYGAPALSRIVLDMDQGGNLVKHHSTSRGLVETVIMSYQYINEVWTLASVERDRTESATTNRDVTKHVWTESIVNEPLRDDEFSLARLGLRKNDKIKDTRSKTSSIFDPDDSPETPKVESINSWLVGLIAAGIVIAAFLFLRGRTRRNQAE